MFRQNSFYSSFLCHFFEIYFFVRSPRIASPCPWQTVSMLTLFLRSLFIYFFLLLIIRLGGKRQLADLQPFDLIVTLIIADLGSTAIGDTDTPLLYSIVPILGLYLVQLGVAYLCLKSERLRGFVCGAPLILIRDGVLDEGSMRRANYTVRDILDNLRAKDIFDLGQVAYAILETNGSLSILQKGAFQQPTLKDLSLPSGTEELSYLLMLQGKPDYNALLAIGMDEEGLYALLRQQKICLRQRMKSFRHL